MSIRYITDAVDHNGQILKDVTLVNVHRAYQCSGEFCVIHNPSEHHMKSWPTVFDSHDGTVSRTCEHGTQHPDPDDVAHRQRVGRDLSLGDHSFECDGCCVPETN